MSAFKHTCPNCRAGLKTNSDLTGRKIRCSKCGQIFRPSAPDTLQETPPVPAVSPPPIPRPVVAVPATRLLWPYFVAGGGMFACLIVTVVILLTQRGPARTDATNAETGDPADRKESSPLPPSGGTSYAFLVGCSGYAETQLKPLPHTVSDVEQFRQALLETGFQADHIKMLHDKQERRFQSEKAKILREFALLLEGLKPEDTVVVALSGHGVHYKNDPTGYFCPLDADLSDRTTLLPFEGKEGLFDMLKACPAGRKLLIVNACRNDPTSDRAQAAEKINLDDAAPEIIPDGIAAIYSCRPGQKSYYDPKRQAGIFFDHVTRAWRGEYGKEGKHTNIEDFFREVSLRTKADADRTYGEAQVPEVKREYRAEWRLPVSQIAFDFREYEARSRANGNANGWLAQHAPERFTEWRRLAEAGNVMAMQLTGDSLEMGCGTEKNGRQAFEWYLQASGKGSAMSMFALGGCHSTGTGVTKDDRQMIEWYRKSADLGYGPAMSSLGACYFNGLGVEKDEKQAINWLRKAADLGQPTGMLELGDCYSNGWGIASDMKQAVMWFRKAAELGNRGSMFRLGVCHEEGWEVEQDHRQAAEWFRKAAEAGDGAGMSRLGLCLQLGRGVAKDEKLAIEWYRKAVKLPFAPAMTNLGECYLMGIGVSADAKLAVEWFRKGISLEEPEAMNALGRCYLKGTGIEKDERAAVDLFRKSARLNNGSAMYNLGECYLMGYGVAEDRKEAINWFRKSADLGDPVAMMSLGVAYENGAEVETNVEKAVEWYRKAAKRGEENAKAALTRLGR